MSIVDKVKGMFGHRSGRAEQGVDKAGDVIDDKTGGKYADRVDQGQDRAKGFVAQDAPKQDDQPGA
jgi:hypothetical protein